MNTIEIGTIPPSVCTSPGNRPFEQLVGIALGITIVPSQIGQSQPDASPVTVGAIIVNDHGRRAVRGRQNRGTGVDAVREFQGRTKINGIEFREARSQRMGRVVDGYGPII